MVERRGEADCREPWREGASRLLRVRSVGSVGRLRRGYAGRQESGSLRHAMVGGPVAAAEITAKPQWAVKTGPGATSGTLVLDQIRNSWGKAVAATIY